MSNEQISFLRSIVEELPAEKARLLNCLLIFPNRRSTRFFADHLAKKFESNSVLLPELYSLDDFLSRVFQKRESSQLEQIILLNALLKREFNLNQQKTIGLPFLVAMLKQMQQIFNQYNDEAQLTRLQELLATIEDNDWKNKIQKNFISICLNFKKILEEHNLATPFFLRYEAIANFEAIGHYFQNKAIYICGFNALSPSEVEIFKRIKANQERFNYQVKFFLDYDQGYLEQPGHQAGYFYHNFWKDFLKEEKSFPSLLKKRKKQINAYSCPGYFSQARMVAHRISEITANQKEEELLQTAIVIADPQALPPLLSALPGDLKKNLTMGLPLKFTPASTFIKLWKNLLSFSLSQDGEIYLSSSFLDKFFLHPFLQTFKFETNNSTQIKLSDLPAETNLLAKLILTSLKEHQLQANISDWLNLLKSILENEELDELTRASAEKLYELSLDVALLQKKEIAIEWKELLNILSELCQYEMINFSGEPLCGVQLLGVLETQCLDFRHLIMLSFNEGIFPPSSIPSTFLPSELIVQIFPVDPRQESNVNAYHFYRLLQRAETIDLFFLQEQEKNQTNPPSRFLLQLEADDNLFSVTRKIVQPFWKGSLRSKFKVEKSEELLNNLKQSVFSASALFSYLKCPLKFYWQYCARVKPPEAESPLEGIAFGNLLHSTLQKIYTPLIKQPPEEASAILSSLLRKELEELETIICSQIREALRLPEEKILQGKELLILEVLKKILKNLIKADIQRFQDKELTIVDLEMKFEMSYQFDNLQLNFKGIIDRLESVDQLYNICDYKSGSSSGTINERKPNFNNLIQFQLSFYSLLFDQDNILLTKITPEKFKESKDLFKTINWNRDQQKIFRLFLEEQILGPMFSPETPFEPAKNRNECSKCYFQFLCF